MKNKNPAPANCKGRPPGDPTPEEIWGPGGLAEQERLKRPEAIDEALKARNEYRRKFKSN